VLLNKEADITISRSASVVQTMNKRVGRLQKKLFNYLI